MKITNINGVCYDRFKVIIIKWLYNINKDTLMFALSGLDDKYLRLWSSKEIVNISCFQIHEHVLLKAISLYINLNHLFLPWDVDVLVCTMCSSCVSPVTWTVMDSTVTFYSLWLCTNWSVFLCDRVQWSPPQMKTPRLSPSVLPMEKSIGLKASSTRHRYLTEPSSACMALL